MKGNLVVLEGTDGSGKSTQFSRLCRHMEEVGRPFQRLVFPQYAEESSALIRMYLRGEFGEKPGDVNAYAASAFYAVDRYASWKKGWETPYKRGEWVLADRYTTSNAVHQGAKLAPGARREFFQWLFDFEYGKLGLPQPTLVLYLDLPTEQSVALLRRREAQTHTRRDIHEKDQAYLASCREAALQAAAVYGWKVIPCCTAGGQLRSVEEIHGEIWREVSGLLR